MSSAKILPPQTYSRLFRPWDTPKESSEKSMCKKECDLINFSEPQSPSSQNYHQNSFYGYPGSILPEYIYNMSSANHLNVGNIGMDPFSLTLMEQEYNRVIAEEARAKLLNSKKQRPKKFKCPTCDVAFSNNGQLKGHIRIRKCYKFKQVNFKSILINYFLFQKIPANVLFDAMKKIAAKHSQEMKS